MSCCREREGGREIARAMISIPTATNNAARHPETKVDPSGLLLADFLGVGENLLKSVNVLSLFLL